MGVRSTAPLLLALTSVSACGDTDASPTDGAALDTLTPEETLVAPPDIPWLADGVPPIAAPAQTPCPSGWREVASADGATTCDPYPEDGALDCPATEAHFPGEPSCSAVGVACPSGEFSAGLPTDRRVVYVRPGATGGDGMTPTSPYGTLREFALGGLPVGSVIALSRGTHAGPVRLARDVTLQGACSAESILRTDVASDREGVVHLVRGRGAVRDLTVADSPRGGIWVLGTDGRVDVEGTVVLDVEMAAMVALDGGQLTAHTVALRDTRSRARDLTFGRALSSQNGATAELTRAVIERNREAGVFAADGGAIVQLEDVLIRDTRSRALDGALGRGLDIERSASALLTRVQLSGNRDAGLFTAGAGTSVSLQDVVVRDTLDQESGTTDSIGLAIHEGATAALTRTTIERNRGVGALVTHAGTTVTLTDAVIRDTQANESDGTVGRGLDVERGATAEVNRAVVERNRDLGVLVDGEGTAAALTDTAIRDTLGMASDDTSGRGLGVQNGASATLTRGLVERNLEVGLFAGTEGSVLGVLDVAVRATASRLSDGAAGAGISIENEATLDLSRALFDQNTEVAVVIDGVGTTATVHDVVVRDTQSAFDGALGRGMAIQRGASAEVMRAVLEGNRDLGMAVSSGGTTATVFDVVIRGTESRPLDGTYGRSLGVQGGARVQIMRALLERGREAGVTVYGSGTSVALTDAVVRDIQARACATTTCPEAPAGHGVGAYDESTLSLTRFEVARAELCGVHLASGGELDLADGEVRENAIGACVQVDGYDVERLTRDVRYIDNETNLQPTTLPVPEPAEPAPTP